MHFAVVAKCHDDTSDLTVTLFEYLFWLIFVLLMVKALAPNNLNHCDDDDNVTEHM